MLSLKQKEKLAIEKYLTASNQYFEIEDFESPDFILKDKERLIGCEVTDFHPDYSPKGSVLHQRESYINDLHDKLKSKIRETNPIGYSFTIDYISIAKEKTKIDSEVELINRQIKENIDSTVLNNPSTNIRRIFIKKIEGFPTRFILMTSSDYVEPNSDWIKPIIESKTNKIEKWRGEYNEKWLLISIGLSRSGDLNLKRLDLSVDLKNNIWNKIILIDIHHSEYIDINAT
jgi:hypothetical protein